MVSHNGESGRGEKTLLLAGGGKVGWGRKEVKKQDARKRTLKGTEVPRHKKESRGGKKEEENRHEGKGAKERESRKKSRTVKRKRKKEPSGPGHKS